MLDEDLVVLVDDDGTPCGTAPRATVHTRDTPLHLAFSCYVRDEQGRLLLTRRAVTKRTWPGVWTNSFCGHQRPGEDLGDTIRRYAGHELGLEVVDLQQVVPDFRYRAVDAGGLVENELCPVWTARTTGQPDPNPDEVAESRWVTDEELRAAVDAAPWALSPWLLLQVPLLEAAHWSPAQAGPR
ncbi:isopentenyl-diphosphate Delta-isomerase [Nocardioides sp. zg-DK7169]|nr:isopentenyl-diphosphate Delta-isomerase [Nocardioides sp. zg-DK7169]